MLHFLSQHLWLIAAGSGVGVAGRYLQLRIRHTHKLILPDPTVIFSGSISCMVTTLTRLLELLPVFVYGNVLETEGAVAYSEFGKVWLVPGDPLASVEQLATVSDCFLKKARGWSRSWLHACDATVRKTL